MEFSKSDFWKAVAAGEAMAFLLLPVFKNVEIFELVAGQNIVLLLFLWFIFLPLAAASGLYIVYRLVIHRWPILFQVGKYGIVGWLNVFLVAGIFNFCIWFTGVAEGGWVDVFAAVAFVLCTINSFFWNKFWTFNSFDKSSMGVEYIKFFLVSAAVSLINIGLLHLLVNIIGAPAGIKLKVWANIVLAITIPIAFFGNFIGYRIFVFKAEKYKRHG